MFSKVRVRSLADKQQQPTRPLAKQVRFPVECRRQIAHRPDRDDIHALRGCPQGIENQADAALELVRLIQPGIGG